jgi:hypothetical protein
MQQRMTTLVGPQVTRMPLPLPLHLHPRVNKDTLKDRVCNHSQQMNTLEMCKGIKEGMQGMNGDNLPKSIVRWMAISKDRLMIGLVPNHPIKTSHNHDHNGGERTPDLPPLIPSPELVQYPLQGTASEWLLLLPLPLLTLDIRMRIDQVPDLPLLQDPLTKVDQDRLHKTWDIQETTLPPIPTSLPPLLPPPPLA